MIVYIDDDCKCHVNNPNGTFRKAVMHEDTKAFFADKCTIFIEGYLLKPDGETLLRDDGKVFSGGEMITPWKPYNELVAAQAQYELDMAEAAAAYQEGVNSAYDQ